MPKVTYFISNLTLSVRITKSNFKCCYFQEEHPKVKFFNNNLLRNKQCLVWFNIPSNHTIISWIHFAFKTFHKINTKINSHETSIKRVHKTCWFSTFECLISHLKSGIDLYFSSIQQLNLISNYINTK